MRLRPQNIAALREAIGSIAPDAAAIRLFGSRLDDEARGGDVDLMIDFDHPVEHPAALSARLAVRASRAIGGRQVDVLLRALNLTQSAIHRIALEEGVLL
ncbi:nucleotidyltransferase domain-containing protein [Methylobacter sp.]|uniref:nucleotidyltransferase domain-containing protein n=1 Tax=Methylobacter sp. TaxID=2051955 RepID=UPI002FDCCE15